jgi:hypothetical protein
LREVTTMLVELESGGGYAGVRRRSSVDTDELAPAERNDVTAALDALAATRSPPASHRPRYRLTVHRPAGVQVVDMVEPDVPAALRPLLTELLRRAGGAG